MAKAEKDEDNKVVALNAPAGLPAALAEAMVGDAGRGVSDAAEDNIVPLIYILQAQSPQVLKNNPQFIKGASASDIWLRNATPPVVAGDQGILYQPCVFFKEWVEWKPRDAGGGFMGRHSLKPAEATQVTDPKNPQRITWRLPNGNDVVETRCHVGLVHGGEFGLKDYPDLIMPYMIALSGSGHTVSRSWMSLMGQFTVGAERKIAPSFARRYRLTTNTRKNAQGEWFGWKVEDAGWVPSVELYNLGKSLNDRFAKGELRAETPAAADEETADEETAEAADDAAARAGV